LNLSIIPDGSMLHSITFHLLSMNHRRWQNVLSHVSIFRGQYQFDLYPGIWTHRKPKVS